ncbi:MAG: carboxylating nicotinate-nucleotide diphosphorylase [Candidatus Hodarchaeaceae archaeon]|nr:carboxylating nicotinate-nucleotide diphosphorylase [Candidatus Hodarchaeaceae archaeon]
MTNVLAKMKIRKMLAEDIGFGDITTETVVPPEAVVTAEIVAKQHGILAGVVEAALAFEEVGVLIKAMESDGKPIKPGDVVMKLEGPARSILVAERTALNLLMRMSGVATSTSEMLEKARRVKPDIILAATRKVMPLLSYFDKRAVRLGGGDTHRFRLDDCVLIKDNHVKLAGGVAEAIRRARSASFSKKVEIEVRKPGDAPKAAEAGADILMFDNMTPAEIKRAVRLLIERGLRERVLLEASGELDLANVAKYAATGVDILSSSYMTFRAPAMDMSLEIRVGKGFKPKR